MSAPTAPDAPPARPALASGEWIGLLGGGQLGRMFAHAAQSLGYRVAVIDPDPDSPTGAVADHHLQADYLDDAALAWLAANCKAVTTEFENVPSAVLTRLAEQGCFVAPEAKAVAIAQDRGLEKRFAAANSIPVAPHALVSRIDDVETASASLFPGILKTTRLGYDGKGQAAVSDVRQAREAFSRLGRVACVLEKKLHLRQEISCVVCRAGDGSVVTFPVAENEHRNGILAVSIVPARISPELERQARFYAGRIAEALNYVGVLCIEFFVLDDGRLVFNEMAPRPHNSGHYTIDACVTSQFEQQARIVAGLPLGDTTAFAASVMLNLLGDLWLAKGERREPPWAELLRDPRARLHLYGKREPRAGRKMGHATCLGNSLDNALTQGRQAARVLGLPPPR